MKYNKIKNKFRRTKISIKQKLSNLWLSICLFKWIIIILLVAISFIVLYIFFSIKIDADNNISNSKEILSNIILSLSTGIWASFILLVVNNIYNRKIKNNGIEQNRIFSCSDMFCNFVMHYEENIRLNYNNEYHYLQNWIVDCKASTVHCRDSISKHMYEDLMNDFNRQIDKDFGLITNNKTLKDFIDKYLIIAKKWYMKLGDKWSEKVKQKILLDKYY